MKLAVLLTLLTVGGVLQAADYHVAKTGDDAGDGSVKKPFLTIQRAADAAYAGDVITVHEGIYRERVNPPRGGTSDDQRIVYQVAPGENVVIKGAEPIANWQHVEDSVWKATLPNSFFGDFNPFAERIQGAWYEAKQAYHAGAVYLNGHWLREAVEKSRVVQSLKSGEGQGAATELMNLQSFTIGVAGKLNASEFVEGSDGVKFNRDDPEKIFVGRMTEGAYIAYEMDFGGESKFMSMVAASPIAGGIVELRKGSVDGEVIGFFDVGFTAEWTHFQRFHGNITPQSGKQTIYCVFKAHPAPVVDPANNTGLWFAEVTDDETVVWADFNGADPTKEFVEINVRQSVFYPEKAGLDYITVRGFTLEQAATPWAGATAEQIGLIGTHWSRGWIIENNTIRYSVCTGVTLGKFGDEHDDTYNYRFQTIPDAVKRGWSEIGHHVVKKNHISHCGKNGIHGSLGAPFSTITGNTIHDIRKNHDFGGCDTAGIKILGGVDVVISHNHIYRCEHWGGIWLDWMAQGARVTGNLLHDNSQDLMFEVNHGPHLVDHNLLLSGRHVTDASGGGAFVQNLWVGGINLWPDLKVRHTPFFKPHSLQIIGNTDIDQHDDRFYNNVFIGAKGTSVYDEHSFKISAEGNVFLAGAKPSTREANSFVADGFDPAVKLTQKGDEWWLEMQVDPAWEKQVQRSFITTEVLGKTKVTDAPFENRDGTPYHIDTDYFGQKYSASNPSPGPFALRGEQELRLKVWPREETEME